MPDAENQMREHPPESHPDAGESGLRARLRRLFVSAEGRRLVAPAPLVSLKGIVQYFWPYARPYRGGIALSIALTILRPAVTAAQLYMIKVIVDEALVPADIGAFKWIVPVIVGLSLIGGVISYFELYVTVRVGQRFLLALRTHLFEHLQALSLDFFERRRLGDILSRITSDIATIETFIVSGVGQIVSSLASFVFFTIALFVLDWRMALTVVVLAPALIALIVVFSRLTKKAAREKRRRTGALTAVAEEGLSNIALVQASNRQGKEADRFYEESLGAYDASIVGARVRAMFTPVIETFQAIAILGVLALGTLAISSGDLTLGSVLAFLAFLQQLFNPIRTLARLYNVFFSASAGAERVIELFQEQPSTTSPPGARRVDRARGAIAFEGVSFQYPAGEREALSEVSFEVEPGEAVALVGHSGAGKSTAAKLLLRFYDPKAGAITLDGHRLDELDLTSLRENVALVLQETLMFDATVRENILFGKPDATDEEIIQAASSADAHEFIEQLPDGYETVVGEKGRLVSGGQRQRIAIARAMIRDAPVLILDEPTTGLDAESQQRIMEPLRRLMSGRTTVVISHNLLTVRDADRILVLERGRLLEAGTHDELLAQDGGYAKISRLHEANVELERMSRTTA